MNFTISRETLLPALRLTSHVVLTNSANPQGSHLLFSQGDTALTITGSDGDCTLRAEVPTEDSKNGEMTLSARQIQEICQYATVGSKLKFSLEEKNKVKIETARSHYQLATLPPEGFALPQQLEGKSLTLPAQELHRLLHKTSCCLPVAEYRPYLMGTLLHITAKGIYAVATDTHKMGVVHWAGKAEVDEEVRVIIPRSSVQELLYMLSLSMKKGGDKEGESEDAPSADKDLAVTLTFSGKDARFEVANFALQTSLVAGTYPDYTAVIPNESQCKTLTVNSENLVNCLHRAAVIAGKGGYVAWTLFSEQMKVEARNQTGESLDEDLSARFTGSDDRVIGFNVTYLLDIMSQMESEQVQIFLSEQSSAEIREPERENMRYMLMPIRQ